MRLPRLIEMTAAVLLLWLAGCAPPVAPASAPTDAPGLVDDVSAARALLDAERDALRDGGDGAPAAPRLTRMVELGMWAEAEEVIAGSDGSDAAVMVGAAELRLLQHRYPEARALVDGVLSADPRDRSALLLDARLRVQAWDLPGAISIAESLLRRDRRDEDAALLIGRTRLLQKRYDDALEWAERVQRWNPDHPGAHLLEADVRYWDQDPARAEPAVIRALELDPFDPDARFSYGYAIWRRVDATQLDAMAAQWNLALDIHPLHYVTHWHWGNGHTNLTYADYAQPEDSTVRARLSAADSLISSGRIAEAVDLARRIGREFPGSVLPAMLRGSAFYMSWEMDRGARLDSAQAAFRDVLDRKPNFGPAHNGLAAVIKQRQFTVLAAYDSLESVIATAPAPTGQSLEAVFPDVRYYPGERVARMTALELGPSIAYLPLIERQGRTYRIPPLHQDLAQAMGRPYFRTSTTFDNRQWMDIRGVGSGAAAIEYVERGAHQERNVLLHEFVHLFHGIVFTDAEARRVRALYHSAMEQDRTLDYYASNNESEFLAQAYPAYFSPVKVHPLNHKSMNTADDLRARDPETHAWIEALVARQRRYLAGDTSALASNWAQVYVNLSETARRGEGGDGEGGRRVDVGAGDSAFLAASALLDTAMVWDAGYVPAMLSRAALFREAEQFAEAASWLERARATDPSHAPVYAAQAALLAARARAGDEDGRLAVDAQAELYREALALERDLAERAALNRRLRELYAEHGRIPDAIAVAAEYAAQGPAISTYLRDRRDEAGAFAHALRARAGYVEESVPFLRSLVTRKPQNYSHRAQLAEALIMAGETATALSVLDEAQRILRAAGSSSTPLAAMLAEIRLLEGDSLGARREMREIIAGDARPGPIDLRVVRVLAALGMSTDARELLAQHPEPRTPADAAEIAYTRGFIAGRRGDVEVAAREHARALELDPYHSAARIALVRTLANLGRQAEATAVAGASLLDLPPGPALRTRIREALNSG